MSPQHLALGRGCGGVSKVEELLGEGEKGESFMLELKAGVGVSEENESKGVCVIQGETSLYSRPPRW